ncbi:MAG TPA: DNA methyltransferase, partial [Dehalococcoidia bacterium]|nr:DNA methyltransferase [Dehalococcoidia bacterium]
GPFAADVKAGKNSPIYNAHAYRTKVPPEGIVPYLLHYTWPGDLVLDPFCGSGMTGVAALMTGRRCLLNVLSPAATHIAVGYTQPVDLPAVQSAWRRVAAQLAPLCAELYTTTCHRCHGPATIQYTVWSDTYGCRACGREIVLWDAAVVREPRGDGYDPPLSALTPGLAPIAMGEGRRAFRPPLAGETGKPRGAVLEQFACPGCGREWAKTALARQCTVPVLIDLECQGGCRPKRAARAPLPEDIERIEAAAARPPEYWVPEAEFDETREMWRGAHRDSGITRACDFWTPRNLAVLAAAWHAINTNTNESGAGGVHQALRFAFTASLFRVSRMRRYLAGGSGVVTGTLYIPSLSLEVNVFNLLAKKVEDYLKARTVLAAARPSPPDPLSGTLERGSSNATPQVAVRTGSATHLAGVPDGAIDYVFTDPPFGANIFYADCSFPWEAWLGCFTDEAHEAVWNKSRKPEQGGKTLDDYAHLIELSFREIARVLKPGRWASVVFHNSDDRVWDAIRDAAAAAGLSLANAVALDKEQRSFKGIKGEKGEERVTNFGIVLNLQKPAGGPARPPAPAVAVATPPTAAPSEPPAVADDAETDERIAAILAEHLAGLTPGRSPSNGEERTTGATPAGEQRTTQFLHSLVIRRLLSEGMPVTDVDYARVERVARAYLKLVDGRWYGLGEEVAPAQMQSALPGLDAHAPRLTDEASAIAWVRELIRANGPQP